MDKESGGGGRAPFLLAVLLVFGVLEAAEAQSEAPKLEVSGGYAFLRDLGDEATSLPLGWNVSLARNFTPSLGVVGDVGGSYKSEEGIDFSEHAFLGGARYSFRDDGVVPYVEGLAGMIRSSVSSGTAGTSAWDFGLQAGVGLHYGIKDNLSVRAALDLRNIFSEGESYQQLRILAGVTYAFGGPLERSARTEPRGPLPPPPSAAVPESRPEPVPPPTPAAPETALPPPPPVGPQEPAFVPEAPVTPSAAAPAMPPSLVPGRAFLTSGDYAQASAAFREQLRLHEADKFTVAVGLFCDTSNVDPLVRAGSDEPVFLLRRTRGGRHCYGVYWGLFGSRQDAQRAIGSIPSALRAAGQAPVAVSRLVR